MNWAFLVLLVLLGSELAYCTYAIVEYLKIICRYFEVLTTKTFSNSYTNIYQSTPKPSSIDHPELAAHELVNPR